MQVAGIDPGTRRRRRSSAAVAVPAAPAPTPTPRAPDHLLEQSSAKQWRTFPVTDLSKADGPWQVDWERAHADAQQVLDAIDFSKRDIVIWAPGTSNAGVHPAFEAAVRDSYKGQGSNLVALRYEASWNLRRSLATGVATLRLVLEGIAARGGDHRVLLAGESQGAWAIGEAIADPAVGKVVDRAILVGHPWLAKHQYDRGQDPRVRVINHQGDMVTVPVKGSPTVALDAMVAVRTLQLAKLGEVLEALAANPDQGVALVTGIAFSVPVLKTFLRNPHVYDGEMSRAVEYLRHGALPVSNSFAQLTGRACDELLVDPGHDEAEHERLRRAAAVAAYAAQRAA